MHYCHLSKEEIWDLTLPQVNVLLAQINEKVKFDIKLAGGEIDETREATEDDITMLEMLTGGR